MRSTNSLLTLLSLAACLLFVFGISVNAAPAPELEALTGEHCLSAAVQYISDLMLIALSCPPPFPLQTHCKESSHPPATTTRSTSLPPRKANPPRKTTALAVTATSTGRRATRKPISNNARQQPSHLTKLLLRTRSTPSRARKPTRQRRRCRKSRVPLVVKRPRSLPRRKARRHRARSLLAIGALQVVGVPTTRHTASKPLRSSHRLSSAITLAQLGPTPRISPSVQGPQNVR